jgi:hypothetical protein
MVLSLQRVLVTLIVVFTCLVLVTLFACAPATTPATQPESPIEQLASATAEVPATTSSDPFEDAIAKDAHWYAERFGVSHEEAVRRLRWQGAIGELDSALRGERRTFAGLWIEHEPVYQIVVAFTVADGSEILQPYLTGKPYAGYITIRQHRYTLAELEAAQREAIAIVNQLAIPTSGGVDVQNNRATLVVGNPDLLLAEIEAAGLSLPDPVAVLPLDPDNLSVTNHSRVEQYLGPDGQTIYFPHQAPSLVYHDGDAHGRLVLDDTGCLRLQPAQDGEAAPLVIWPHDYHLRLAENNGADNGIEILDGRNTVVASTLETDIVSWGGSHTTSFSGPDMPIDACPGPYWLLAPISMRALESYDNTLTARSDEPITILVPKIPTPGEGETLVYPTAQIHGTLIQEGPCLRLKQNKENGTTYLIIWPPDYYYEERNGTIMIVNGRNQIRATVGEMVELGGGHMPGSIAAELDPTVKEYCPGPYLFGW